MQMGADGLRYTVSGVTKNALAISKTLVATSRRTMKITNELRIRVPGL